MIESDNKTIEKEDDVSRRSFIHLMGASAALASMGGCILRRPVQHIVPYGNLPENMVLGRPMNYATSFSINGDVCGLLVESHEGRPTKIEGLEAHPDNKGKTNAIAQSTILELYDPDRSFSPYRGKETATWEDFEKDWAKIKASGKSIAILVDDINSPSFARMQNEVMKTLPQADWYQHSALSDINVKEGTDKPPYMRNTKYNGSSQCSCPTDNLLHSSDH